MKEKPPSSQAFHILLSLFSELGPEKVEIILNYMRPKILFTGCRSEVSCDADGSLGGILGARMQPWITPMEPILGAHSKAGGSDIDHRAHSSSPKPTQISGDNLEISHGRKSKLQIRPSFQGQAQFLILHHHRRLSQGRNKCLMKEWVDKRDDNSVKKKSFFGPHGLGHLVYH